MTRQILEDVLREMGIGPERVEGSSHCLRVGYQDLQSTSYEAHSAQPKEIPVQQYVELDFSEMGVAKIRRHFVREEKDTSAGERILRYDDQNRVTQIESRSFFYSPSEPQQVVCETNGQCEKLFDQSGRVVRVNDPGVFEMDNEFQPDGTVITTTHYHLFNHPQTTHQPRKYVGPTSPLTSDRLWREFYRENLR